jgi:hypothetical protein
MTGSLYRAPVGMENGERRGPWRCHPVPTQQKWSSITRPEDSNKLQDVHIQLPPATLEALPSRDVVYIRVRQISMAATET